MRNPNGYGSISKIGGKRRKPYRVRVTTGYWTDENGKAHQIQRIVGTYATYQEAVTALAAYNANPLSLEPNVTFRQIWERWSAERFAQTRENTRRSYIAAFNAVPMLHDMEFRSLRKVHLQAAIDTCGKNFPTLQNICVIISGMYQYALENDIVSRDYSRFINLSAYRLADKEKRKTTPPKHTSFTEDELAILWDHADDPFVRELLMLSYSGLRIKEYLTLTADAVDVPARMISIDDSKTEAGIRLVPIAEKTAEMWDEHRQKISEPSKLSNAKRYSDFTEAMAAKMEEFGLPKHLPHDTRHTTATILRKRNADPLIIKRILGHKVEDITERVYTHTDVKQLLDAINLM